MAELNLEALANSDVAMAGFDPVYIMIAGAVVFAASTAYGWRAHFNTQRAFYSVVGKVVGGAIAVVGAMATGAGYGINFVTR